MASNETPKRRMTRRESLRIFGAAGAAAAVGLKTDWQSGLGGLLKGGSVVSAQTGSCVVKPALTEGPYFVDERLKRVDIRADPMTGAVKEGVPLRLTFNVTRAEDCTPLAGAVVDVWHADALGTYSDVGSARGQKYLRGYQATDANGAANFVTIYPGWYPGRTVHIHFKIRVFSGNEAAYEFTSQLFFEESVTAAVVREDAYRSHGSPDTPNSRDGIYGQSGGRLTLALAEEDEGYAGTFEIALRGVPESMAPEILGAAATGKKLVVTGSDFGAGAKLLVDGVRYKKARNDASNPTTVIVAPKLATQLVSGQSVVLQVKNPDGQLSNEFTYTA